MKLFSTLFSAVLMLLISNNISAKSFYAACYKKGPPPPLPETQYTGPVATYMRLGTSGKEFYVRPTRVIGSGGIMIIGDLIFPIRYCPKESKFVCAYSNWAGFVFAFAVPRRPLKVGEKWAFGNNTFLLIPNVIFDIPGGIEQKPNSPSVDISILGSNLNLHLIEAFDTKSERPKQIFFYDRNKGLIGEADPNPNDYLSISWLMEAYGPGSPQYDSHILPDAFLNEKEIATLLHGDAIPTCFTSK